MAEIGRVVGETKSNVHKYMHRPVQLPVSWAEESLPHRIQEGGKYKMLLMNDIHIPFHDKKAVEAAIRQGKKAGCQVVMLNGDIMDQHNVSRYPHDGSKLTYVEEIESGVKLLEYVRQEFPKAEIVFKEGNHEERLDKYILSRSLSLFGLKAMTLKSLVKADNVGVEWIGDQRVIHAGKLRIIHGHEYGSGAYAPVNAARWLMLRARRPAICGHLHQTSEQIEMNIDQEQLATWSVGCLCGLSPRYRRLNAKWNHGFAIVSVERNGEFEVHNQRIVKGKVT